MAVNRQVVEQRNQDATIFVGNLDDKIDDDLLWELFTQVGPVVDISIPKDPVTKEFRGFAFVEFGTDQDAEYACKVMNMVRLFNKPIRVNVAGADKKGDSDIGANLFVGNLAPEVDEKTLFDTFSRFGSLTGDVRVGRDPETGNPKGHGFVKFDSFEAADLAIESMNGQFLANRPITVQYSFKPGTRERHGSQAERILAAEKRKTSKIQAHQHFAVAEGGSIHHATAPPQPAPMVGMAPGMDRSGNERSVGMAATGGLGGVGTGAAGLARGPPGMPLPPSMPPPPMPAGAAGMPRPGMHARGPPGVLMGGHGPPHGMPPPPMPPGHMMGGHGPPRGMPPPPAFGFGGMPPPGPGMHHPGMHHPGMHHPGMPRGAPGMIMGRGPPPPGMGMYR